MNAGQLRNLIAEVSDSTEYICMIFEKSEADEKCEEQEAKPLTDEEWESVIRFMANDDGLWQSFYESFGYSVNRVIEIRKKGK